MADLRAGLGYLLVGQPTMASAVARALATKGNQPQYLEGRFELGVVALDLTRPEYEWLRRVTTWHLSASQAAVAAQFQAIQFGQSVSGRQMISVIDEVTICNENVAAERFLYGISKNTNGVTSGPFFGFPADDRVLDANLNAQSGSFLGTQSNVGGAFAGVASGLITIQPGDSVVLKGPWILTAKAGPAIQASFCVQAATQNRICTASFKWRERELLSSEQ